MKLYIAAAGALLLGTSAFAFAPGFEAEKGWSKNDVLAAEKSSQQEKLATGDVIAGAKAQSAAAWSADEPKPIQASAVTWQEPEPAAEADPDLDLAETPPDEPVEPATEEPVTDEMASDTAASDIAPAETAADTTAAPVQIASADLSPRPAAGNYPACDPGPGDDSCIQLYEPGVRVALASWNQPTGGLAQPGEAMMASAEADEATGMGGPYEPVDGAVETAMAGDGLVDAEAGETSEIEAL